MRAGQQYAIGVGVSTVLPDMDFETYSEAGYVYRDGKRKYIKEHAQSGLECVGAARYAEHPSTEALSLSYDLKDGRGSRLWAPALPDPQELFNYIAAGGIIEAHNSMFEWLIWSRVCVKMGWPPLPIRQLRCSMAKARAFALPGKLEDVAAILGGTPKDPLGKMLLDKFSIPQKPTKADPRRRHFVRDCPVEASQLYQYNITDIIAESGVSARCPDLSAEELELWLIDQEINARGVMVDKEALDNCIAIVDQAFEKYTAELRELTGGAVQTVGETAKLSAWCATHGLQLPDMKKETVESTLKQFRYLDDLPPGAPPLPHLALFANAVACRRPLEIRQIIGSAAVKKLYAAQRCLCDDQRLRDLFIYYKAHTGRFAGCGAQPQNFPNSGLAVYRCPCGAYHCDVVCPTCEQISMHDRKEWNADAVEFALTVIATRNIDTVELYFGDAIAAVSGCLRGLFVAKPGHDLIDSDFSAIEAVVLACIAGEQWRIDVFNGHGMIYEMSAAKIKGIPFEDFVRHKQETGEHHPLRKKLGKVAELASGYQGGLGAWKNFGADKFMTDDEIEAAKKAWRAESPMIVNFWYGVEKAARQAIQMPGSIQNFRGFQFGVKEDVLYLRLLSGRFLKYHQPRLHPEILPWGKTVLKITFMGIASPGGQWVRKDTYGGRLTENIVQAVARDIFTSAMVNVTHAGYPVVLHTHDQITSEVPHGFGSIEEYEQILMRRPLWCLDWPIRAAGGWRGRRYRKD